MLDEKSINEMNLICQSSVWIYNSLIFSLAYIYTTMRWGFNYTAHPLFMLWCMASVGYWYKIDVFRPNTSIVKYEYQCKLFEYHLCNLTHECGIVIYYYLTNPNSYK